MSKRVWKGSELGCLPLCCRVLLAGCLALVAASCLRSPVSQPLEVAYVGGAEVALRDELGPSSGILITLRSGERVEVLGRRPQWARVRSAAGQTGWVQSRFLVSPQIYDQFRLLAAEASRLPSQGKAVIQREVNLRWQPGRDSQSFYRLPEGEEVEVVSHRALERAAPGDEENWPQEVRGADGASAKLEIEGYEDWLLIRAERGRAGWTLENFLEMNVPFEVAQYNEGLRVRAWFVIHRELDKGEERPWHLWATIHSLRGLPFDFDEIRVFVWNPQRSRYETSYRERDLIGFYPIEVGSRETPAGRAPAFRLQLEDEKGGRYQKSYSMYGRLVRPDR